MASSAYDVMEKIYKKAGWVEAKNSWGKKYGDKGYNKFSLAYIKKNMTSAYACIDLPKEALKKKVARVADFNTYDIKNEGLWIPRV